jgi:hypothetical protein
MIYVVTAFSCLTMRKCGFLCFTGGQIHELHPGVETNVRGPIGTLQQESKKPKYILDILKQIGTFHTVERFDVHCAHHELQYQHV